MHKSKLMVAIIAAGVSVTTYAKSNSQGATNGQPFQQLQEAVDRAEQAATDAISAETAARIAGDQALESAIAVEEAARISADSAEAAARSAVDAAEAAARIAGDQALDQRVQANADAIADLQQQSQSILDAIDNVNTDIDNLESSVSTIMSDYATGTQLADAQNSLLSLLSGLASEIERVDTDSQTTAAALSNLSVDISTELSSLTAVVDSNTSGISLLNTSVAGLNANMTAAQSQLADHETRITALENQVGDLFSRVATLEDSSGGPVSIDLADVFSSYQSEGRDVHLWKTPRAAVLDDYVNFCQDRGLDWWAPRSDTDAQKLLDFARLIDNYHTWIQVYGLVTQTGNPATVNGYAIAPDAPSCIAGSSEGWAGIRDWGCSLCDPDGANNYGNTGLSYCWDTNHQYDWFACETP